MYTGELEILKQAILNEHEGYQFLQALNLARWEQEHLDKLEKAYDFAREEWWSKQNFSPA